MQTKPWIKLLLIGCCVLSLTACSARKNRDQAAINDANAAYSNNGAQAQGLGEESRFGDQAGSESNVSRRVYYFDFDSNVVRDADRASINNNAQYLVSHPSAKAMLEGHTDPRGSREYNIGLGERRAKAVADILTAKGVNPAQIRIVSYGSEKLASPGHSDSDYQQDRRVVLVYLQP